MNNYWNDRYKKGGNSGSGSLGTAGMSKAGAINGFIEKYSVHTIADFGCGDGNIADMLCNYESYFGYDASLEAVKMCRERFKYKKTMLFFENVADIPRVDMCISIDVIYHILDDADFEMYMSAIFQKANKYVLVFSSNTDENRHSAPHIRHREFARWITENTPHFELVDTLGNITQTSAAMFVYKNTKTE